MAITALQIADSALILPLIKQQSVTMLEAYSANPRLSSVFATQQRWLLGHMALGLHFRAAAQGELTTLSRFLTSVTEHAVSSRNTGDAFIKEMIHYGYASLVDAATTDARGPYPSRPSHWKRSIPGPRYIWSRSTVSTTAVVWKYFRLRKAPSPVCSRKSPTAC